MNAGHEAAHRPAGGDQEAVGAASTVAATSDDNAKTPTTAEQRDRLLKVISDYAESVERAEKMSQERTIETARAMTALYEDGQWVEEYLEQSPRPKNASNRFAPDSRNRFHGWLRATTEARNWKAPSNQHTYRLLKAADIAAHIPNFARAKLDHERTIRPLGWLIKERREDRIPEVWNAAVALAGSADKVTEEHVKAALATFKRDVLGVNSTGKSPTAQDRRSRQVSRWRQKHLVAVNRYRELAEEAAFDKDAWSEFEAAWLEIKTITRETADAARGDDA